MALQQHIEALIFASEEAVTLEEIASFLSQMRGKSYTPEDLLPIIKEIQSHYTGEEYAFELVETGGGYRFLTKPQYHHTIALFLNLKSNKRLSAAALETLAIIAYKQPVTKSEIEAIRGVNCDYTLQRLLEKDLIAIKGRLNAPGKPLIYVTTKKFMDFFGLNSPDDLPKPKDLVSEEENAIGEPVEDER